VPAGPARSDHDLFVAGALRALASDPAELLLDEPSQGPAPMMVRELARAVRALPAEGVTVLLVEQNLSRPN